METDILIQNGNTYTIVGKKRQPPPISKEQMQKAIREQGEGESVSVLAKGMGISEPTYYYYKKKWFGENGVKKKKKRRSYKRTAVVKKQVVTEPEHSVVEDLKEENTKLRLILGDLLLKMYEQE